MKDINDFGALVPVEKVNHKFFNLSEKLNASLRDMVQLSLQVSGSSQVARGLLLNLYYDKKKTNFHFPISSLSKFDKRNRNNALNIINLMMNSPYDGIWRFIPDEKYWAYIKKMHKELGN